MSKEKSILVMNVYDTKENGRSEYTRQTLANLIETVNFRNNELYIINQNSCELTKEHIDDFVNHMRFLGSEVRDNIHVVRLKENIGTARGFNLAAKERNGRHVIKLDNDVVFNTKDWVEILETAAERCPEIGIFGVKRKDLEQHDKHQHPNFVSSVEMVPHEPGENWLFAEVTNDIMGTCVLYSNRLLDKVGYSFQWGVYGFEDNLLCVRSRAAGFENCFVHPIELDHIDTGANPYTETKRKQAHEAWENYQVTAGAILRGEMPYYYDFY